MTGTYEHSIDDKGRLFIPAKLREELGSVFYLAAGVKENLTIYPMEAWNVLRERAAALTTTQAAAMDVFFASAYKCEPDKQGRFLIPAELRQYAGITQDVTFIGQGGHAEIWDSAAYDKLEQETLTPENLTAVMEELGF